jgi:hypothetical protein
MAENAYVESHFAIIEYKTSVYGGRRSVTVRLLKHRRPETGLMNEAAATRLECPEKEGSSDLRIQSDESET